MFRTKFIGAAAALLLAATAPASAATISNVQGVVHEGGVPPADDAPAPPDFDLGDFNSTADDPTLELIGDTAIYGGVAHRTTTKYFDSWTIDFGAASYTGEFNWVRSSTNFDGQLLVGGVQHLIANLPSGSLDLGVLSGTVTFVIDPLFGDFGPDPDEVATWDLQLTQVASVPLPAGGLLLVSGLLGMGLIRRRNRA